ncbi:unnamed protein product [Parajaminaea phylloscopi]
MHVWLRSSPRALLLVNQTDGHRGRGRTVLEVSSTDATHTSGLSSTSSQASLGHHAGDQNGSQPATSDSARAVVQMIENAECEWNRCRRLTQSEATGCLGLMNVGNDLFLCIVTHGNEVGPIRPGETVMSIGSVAFFCVNRPTWDGLDVPEQYNPAIPMGTASHGPLDPYDALLPPANGAASGSNAAIEHPCASLKRLLGSGSFYFAANGTFDLSSRLSRRVNSVHKHDVSQYDERFVWNTFMIGPLMEFRSRLDTADRDRLDSEGFLLLAIQGYAATFDMSMPILIHTEGEKTTKHPDSSIALVSRLSWRRAGTRFNTRGVDDDGNVANFVETETIVSHDGVSMSYIQLRGSLPLFWEQPGLQTFSPRIQITRSRRASQPAFDRHFSDLLTQYSRVHALNLLGTRDAETVLSAAYAEHMRNSMAVDNALPPEHEDEAGNLEGEERIGITDFDFHTVSRNTGGLDGVRSALTAQGPIRLKHEEFSCTIIDSVGTVRRRQRGVFRTNCLDCLDRTNVVQAMLSELLLSTFFDKAAQHKDSFQPLSGGAHPIWAHHRTLWAENGDALSRIYAGTGALNSTYTRTGNAKKTFGSLLSDAAKSAGRMYINNFQDKSKQNVIDALLGNMANQRTVEVYDPIHDAVNRELSARVDEYSTRHDLLVFAGTWNLNARAPSESLEAWLCPDGDTEPDIFALGFQEIVQLTPQQILLTDPSKLKVWESVIMDTLMNRPNRTCEYVLLRSEQLVGTALTIVVKASLIPAIRQVEATNRKTGLKGMSGNKGGVAIRFAVHDTSLCFVTAHFAAGHSNVDERNEDYLTISRGLSFNRGRSVAGHDHVIWLGDFNYRIDMPNERVRALADASDYDALQAFDQLHRSRDVAFVGYHEGALTFPPTYKYDVGSDVYDTSEKQRIPAWTDRILFLQQPPGGHQLRQTTYSRAELKTSDHRPVFAIFLAEIRVFDKDRRNAMRREVLARSKAGQARPVAGVREGGREVADGDQTIVGSVAAAAASFDDDLELPPPSSPSAAIGRNWFDVQSDGATSSHGSETGRSWSEDDDRDQRDFDESRNPFLNSRSTALDAAVAAPGSQGETSLTTAYSDCDRSSTGSPVKGRRIPPPAPPRPWKAGVSGDTSTPASGSDDVARFSPQDHAFFQSSMSASSSSSLPLGDGEGRNGPPLPSRPRLGNRSSSYAGTGGVSLSTLSRRSAYPGPGVSGETLGVVESPSLLED